MAAPKSDPANTPIVAGAPTPKAAPVADPVAPPVVPPVVPPILAGGDRTEPGLPTPPGVVCVLAPVSVSFAAAVGPAVKALAAGNAVIVKTTSSAPLIGALIERLFDVAFAEFPGGCQVWRGPRRL